MHYDVVIVRYGEISLKSPYVRNHFESILVQNIKRACSLKDIKIIIKRERGRIYIETKSLSILLKILQRIFGVISFSPSVKTNSDMESLSISAGRIAEELWSPTMSFALRIQRTGTHPYTSQDVAEHVGHDIVKATNASVNLSSPDVPIYIEIRNQQAYLFTEKISGPGGLPVGTQGKVLALIDHPQSIIATWYLLHRGCTIHCALTDKKYDKSLNKFLTDWYIPAPITYITNGKNLYQELTHLTATNYCEAVVTHHNLNGKTQENITQITQQKQHMKLPVLTPLIALDREEIQQKEKKIGIIP